MLIEVCASSLKDCLIAQECGAHRIELNAALHLGGLTPSVVLLSEVKQMVHLPVVCMVRPRGAGFCYNHFEKQLMLKEAKLLLEYGADGIVFGCLNELKQVDSVFVQEMVTLVKAYQKDIIFHRAFDCVADVDEAMATLLTLGINRILTSGTQVSAWEGRHILKALQQTYGHQIELCMGAGIQKHHIATLVQETGIRQCHASFKKWFEDKTTVGNGVSYQYGEENGYDGVSKRLLKQFMYEIEKTIN